MRPVLEVFNIFSYSEAIAAIEVDILFTISRSLNIKKNYFDRFWIASTVLLAVEFWLPRRWKKNTHNYSGGKNLFLDVAVTCPVQHKYVVDAAQMLGFCCNGYADEVKTKKLWSKSS